MTTEERTMTTKEMIAARKATGDTLATNEFSFGTLSGDGIEGYRLSCRLYERGSYHEIARDPRDGECFPTYEDAVAYGFEAGHLIWFNDWKDAHRFDLD
jgi:hypothetical protein